MAFIRAFSLEILLRNRFFENQDRTTSHCTAKIIVKSPFEAALTFAVHDG